VSEKRVKVKKKKKKKKNIEKALFLGFFVSF